MKVNFKDEIGEHGEFFFLLYFMKVWDGSYVLRSNKMLCVHCINFLLRRTQYQAGQAEKQIKAEFERLRQFLNKEEAKRLKALANEEEEKIAAIQELITQTDKDIVELNELIDSLKKEMGNEDLPLLRVRKAPQPNLVSCLIFFLMWIRLI